MQISYCEKIEGTELVWDKDNEGLVGVHSTDSNGNKCIAYYNIIEASAEDGENIADWTQIINIVFV